MPSWTGELRSLFDFLDEPSLALAKGDFIERLRGARATQEFCFRRTDGTTTCTQTRVVHYVDAQGAQARIDLARTEGLGFLAPPTGTSSAWFPIGPQATISSFNPPFTSGRITALAVNPNNANNVYLGSADGGLWITDDGRRMVVQFQHDHSINPRPDSNRQVDHRWWDILILHRLDNPV